MTPKQQLLTDLLEPTVISLGLNLWNIEIIGHANRSILRLVIDHSERSITVGDCEQVSRQVSRILDVENPLFHRYSLEVSSPGIERSLHCSEHFRQFVGFEAKLKLKEPFECRKTFTGIISCVQNDIVLLQTGNTEYEFPVEQIERGQLILADATNLGGKKNGK